MDDGLRRGQADDEGERVDEIVRIDPGVKPDQLGALDRERGFVVEAPRSGVESLLQRRFELDLAQASIAIAGISELGADKGLAWSEAILSERVFGVVVSAGLLERAVAELDPYAAHLVAVPSDADESRDGFVRDEQNFGFARRLVSDWRGFLRGGKKTLSSMASIGTTFLFDRRGRRRSWLFV